jgi:ABC-type lipoprotein release transport system permease subunit
VNLVLAVFIAFLALFAGAGLVGFVVFLVILQRRMNELQTAVVNLVGHAQMIASDHSSKQIATFVGSIAGQLPALMAALRTSAEAYNLISTLVFRKPQEPGAGLVSAGIPQAPSQSDDASSFVAPRTDQQLAQDERARILAQVGIKVDEDELYSPAPPPIEVSTVEQV